MLSRVANQLYWYGRYLERVECTARLIRVNANLLLDLPREVEIGWMPLVEILGLDAEFARLDQPADERHVVRFLTLDEKNPSSLISCIASARTNLRSTRDIVARELWEQTNQLHLMMRDSNAAALRQKHDFLTRIIMDVNTITGLSYSVMSSDLAFQFMRLGANLERADMTTRILDIRAEDLLLPGDSAIDSQFDNILWMSVLKSLSAYQLYRQHVRKRVSGPDVLRYLLQDQRHPRSLAFCIDRLKAGLGRLPDHEAPLQHVTKLSTRVNKAPVKKLAGKAMADFLDDIQVDLHGVHDAITQRYFDA